MRRQYEVTRDLGHRTEEEVIRRFAAYDQAAKNISGWSDPLASLQAAAASRRRSSVPTLDEPRKYHHDDVDGHVAAQDDALLQALLQQQDVEQVVSAFEAERQQRPHRVVTYPHASPFAGLPPPSERETASSRDVREATAASAARSYDDDEAGALLRELEPFLNIQHPSSQQQLTPPRSPPPTSSQGTRSTTQPMKAAVHMPSGVRIHSKSSAVASHASTPLVQSHADNRMAPSWTLDQPAPLEPPPVENSFPAPYEHTPLQAPYEARDQESVRRSVSRRLMAPIADDPPAATAAKSSASVGPLAAVAASSATPTAVAQPMPKPMSSPVVALPAQPPPTAKSLAHTAYVLLPRDATMPRAPQQAAGGAGDTMKAVSSPSLVTRPPVPSIPLHLAATSTAAPVASARSGGLPPRPESTTSRQPVASTASEDTKRRSHRHSDDDGHRHHHRRHRRTSPSSKQDQNKASAKESSGASQPAAAAAAPPSSGTRPAAVSAAASDSGIQGKGGTAAKPTPQALPPSASAPKSKQKHDDSRRERHRRDDDSDETPPSSSDGWSSGESSSGHSLPAELSVSPSAKWRMHGRGGKPLANAAPLAEGPLHTRLWEPSPFQAVLRATRGPQAIQPRGAGEKRRGTGSAGSRPPAAAIPSPGRVIMMPAGTAPPSALPSGGRAAPPMLMSVPPPITELVESGRRAPPTPRTIDSFQPTTFAHPLPQHMGYAPVIRSNPGLESAPPPPDFSRPLLPTHASMFQDPVRVAPPSHPAPRLAGPEATFSKVIAPDEFRRLLAGVDGTTGASRPIPSDVPCIVLPPAPTIAAAVAPVGAATPPVQQRPAAAPDGQRGSAAAVPAQIPTTRPIVLRSQSPQGLGGLPRPLPPPTRVTSSVLTQVASPMTRPTQTTATGVGGGSSATTKPSLESVPVSSPACTAAAVQPTERASERPKSYFNAPLPSPAAGVTPREVVIVRATPRAVAHEGMKISPVCPFDGVPHRSPERQHAMSSLSSGSSSVGPAATGPREWVTLNGQPRTHRIPPPPPIAPSTTGTANGVPQPTLPPVDPSPLSASSNERRNWVAFGNRVPPSRPPATGVAAGNAAAPTPVFEKPTKNRPG